MIFFIAALHALPIFVVAWKSNNKAWLWAVAIISAIVAGSSGNPAYTFVDLLAICIALWNCLEVIKRRVAKESKPQQIAPIKPQESAGLSRWIGALLVIGVLAFIFLQSDKSPSAVSSQSPQSIAAHAPTPTNASPAPPVPSLPAQQATPRPQLQTNGVQERMTVERCLKIVNDRKMTECLEKVK